MGGTKALVESWVSTEYVQHYTIAYYSLLKTFGFLGVTKPYKPLLADTIAVELQMHTLSTSLYRHLQDKAYFL